MTLSTTMTELTMTGNQSVSSVLSACKSQVESQLDKHLPRADSAPQRLHEAMRYAVLNGGKRVRAALVYMTGDALGAPKESCHLPACAVELIHAYSLVHDDLPAMDNDDLRRGKPTCHIAFDEATALLAGDALQTLAFEVLTEADGDVMGASRARSMVRALALGSGPSGMAGGQAIDLASVGQKISVDELRNMHELKTGALIRASVKLGALASDSINQGQLDALDSYAHRIGLAFQIQDDILDVEGDTATLGKQQGADEALDKPTYPALLGLDAAKALAQQMHGEAMDALGEWGPEADSLRELSAFIVQRSH